MIDRKIIDRARQLLPALGMAPAISRALAEHKYRYVRPADYAQALLDVAEALGKPMRAAPPPPPPITMATLPDLQPIDTSWYDTTRAMRAAVAERLDRKTSTGHRAPPSKRRRCTCGHGEGTHMVRGRTGGAADLGLTADRVRMKTAWDHVVSPSPCLWNDCPCEAFTAR